jgi:hypothetical protein
MSLKIYYTETISNDYLCDLPEDFNLLDDELLSPEYLPNGWDKETFTVKDLLNQSEDFIKDTIENISIGFAHNTADIDEYIEDDDSSYAQPEIEVYNYNYDGGSE